MILKTEYIDHMGDDLRVVNAARVSFDKESEWYGTQYQCNDTGGWSCKDRETHTCSQCDQRKVLKDGDERLLKYLATHGHWTPFSHPQITIRETVPIFVARQRFKHVIGFTYNEVSRRYVSDEPEFFTPESWRGAPVDGAKQGCSEESIQEILMKSHGGSFQIEPDFQYSAFIESVTMYYKSLIDSGVAPEQARMILPQSMMTSYYVTGSLAAWARAYKLRIDAHSQKEIRDLAVQWGDIIEPLFPISWSALK